MCTFQVSNFFLSSTNDAKKNTSRLLIGERGKHQLPCWQIQLPALSSFFDISFIFFFCQSMVLLFLAKQLTGKWRKRRRRGRNCWLCLRGRHQLDIITNGLVTSTGSQCLEISQWPLSKFLEILFENEALGYNGSIFDTKIVNSSRIVNVVNLRFAHGCNERNRT